MVQWSTARTRARSRARAPQGGVTWETLENAGKTTTSTLLYVVTSARAPARARARALCFLLKKGADFASSFGDKVGTFVIDPP